MLTSGISRDASACRWSSARPRPCTQCEHQLLHERCVHSRVATFVCVIGFGSRPSAASSGLTSSVDTMGKRPGVGPITFGLQVEHTVASEDRDLVARLLVCDPAAVPVEDDNAALVNDLPD